MEIKINKEIKEYTETMFFGLSVRRSASTSDAVPFWGRKRFHGFAWWEPRPLRRSVLSDITV